MGAGIWLPLAMPALLATVSMLSRRRRWTRYAPVVASVVALISGVFLVVLTRSWGAVTSAGGTLRVDALSAYLLAVVGAVALTATWAGLPGTEGDDKGSGGDGAYSALLCLFLAAMTLALLADNLGVMWIAIEATTITTAFLVGHHGDRRALEAAWKYVVLGSVGVSIAFLGVVLIYAATTAGGAPTLSWVLLAHPAQPLDPDLIRVGVALAVLGFATKAGLAPMHSWLPDAHSQAPAEVSALMSGVLLSVAFYAILRIRAISDAVLGPTLMQGMLLTGGLMSLLVAATLILTQRDYKRMLAYSSIEHMGLLALGAAIGGPLAIGAVLVHILGHGLAKASIFVVAGRILTVEGTSRIDGVHGLLGRRPRLAIPFLAAMAALLGFPPSVLFFTEVAIIVAGWQRGLGWAMAAALSLLLVVFAGLARHTVRMTLGAPDPAGPPRPADAPTSGLTADPSEPRPPGHSSGPMLPVGLALALVAVIGFLAGPLRDVIALAVASLGGTS
ncbi:MAG: proton-conducting transporter membrane subunit [Lapillicoccus sp.]